ncbi:hypothetical protein GUITHDRAFT_154800, partial [Guillardia theta CCMP2712]
MLNPLTPLNPVNSDRRRFNINIHKTTLLLLSAAGTALLCFLAWQHRSRNPSALFQEPLNGHLAASLNVEPLKDSLPTYNPRHDPWLRAGKGSYQLWANEFALKHGDGKRYGKGYGSHGLYSVNDEPNRLNKRNGWERAEFRHWLTHQGGDSSDFWEKKGFPTV